MSLIAVNNLCKYYRVVQSGSGTWGKLKSILKPDYNLIRAVDDVSFQIDKGEVVGYLGPNGAGKSTTIKMLTGVLYPDSGYVLVDGLEPYKNRKKNSYHIGIVYGQRSQLWWDLPLLDSFEIFKAIYKIPTTQYRKNLDLLIDIMDLKDFLNQPVRKLSLGQRMKGEITASLLHNPSILYLDEPTIGLDVLSKNNVLELLQLLNKEKKTTILLTSHNLADIEKVCQRIIIIDKGKVILDDSQENIKDKFGKSKVIVVEFEGTISNIKVPVGNIVNQENNKVWIEFNKDEISAYDLIASLKENTGVKDISINEENIESIVTKIYKKGIVNC